MSSATKSKECRVAAFYLQPDNIRFPFKLPNPGEHGGLQLRCGWIFLAPLEALQKMGTQSETVFLCDFPVTVLVEGGDLARFRAHQKLRLGEAKIKVAITGDACGEKSHECGFSDACLLRRAAVLAEVIEEGEIRRGDFLIRSQE